MKGAIRWAAKLYPAEWRAHYGEEFEVLLEDARLRWSDVGDVLRGVTIMRMTTLMTYPKMALLTAIMGAVLVGGWSFTIADRYLATSAMMLTPAQDGGAEPAQALQQVRLKVFGRDNLVKLIRNPKLDLYQKERQSRPVEDIAEDVMRRHIAIMPYYPSNAVTGVPFRIVFQYPDRHKALAVVEELMSEFAAAQIQLPAAHGTQLRVLENPILPSNPIYPLRPSFFIIGAFGGGLIGLLTVAIWRRAYGYSVIRVDVPKETKQFVDSQIAAGQYRNVADYVGALIRADQRPK